MCLLKSAVNRQPRLPPGGLVELFASPCLLSVSVLRFVDECSCNERVVVDVVHVRLHIVNTCVRASLSRKIAHDMACLTLCNRHLYRLLSLLTPENQDLYRLV